MSQPRHREGPPPSDRTVVDPRSPSESEAALEIGTTVDGRYCVESELGRGGMGVVYLASDTWLDRRVALKVIAPTWARDGEITARFLREAKALASIRSNYVVQVYAFGVHEGSYFFAMEYVRGRTVKQILSEHRKHGDTIPPHRTLTILNRIARGLDAVHAAGILHRDVKPSNLVIEEDTGRPVLVDFGLAVPEDDPAAALALGTPQYMAPEQGGVGVPGATVSVRTDIYALGVTAFEMLTGELPFDTDDRARLMRWHARKTPPALSAKRPDLAPFDTTIARALAKDPADRYPSCTAFAEVLAAASDRWVHGNLPTVPPPPGSRPGLDHGDAPPLPPRAPSFERPASDTTPPAPMPGPAVTMTPSPNAVPFAPSSADVSPSSPASPSRAVHVLVVDDSPVFRKFTMQAAQIAFFRCKKSRAVAVRGAGSGQEALELTAEQAPDLVILDFDMPGLDGVVTLSRLREMPGGHSARVVVLSGRVSAADRWRFAVLGVNEFVRKPIGLRQLVDRLERIARRFEESERQRDTPAEAAGATGAGGGGTGPVRQAP
jgi:serine/threonine protein kinase